MGESPMTELPGVTEETSAQSHESARARWWRVNVVKMSVQELADLTGYSPQAIYLMERGVASDGSLVKTWAFKRYKMACAGAMAQADQGRPFEWQ